MPKTYHSPVLRYWWIDWAARRPAPILRITVALPVTTSAPANTPSRVVRCVLSLA